MEGLDRPIHFEKEFHRRSPLNQIERSRRGGAGFMVNEQPLSVRPLELKRMSVEAFS